MWQTNYREFPSRLLVRIAGYVPILATAAGGVWGARSMAEEGGAARSLLAAPHQESRHSASSSPSRGPTLCTFWRPLTPLLVAVGLFCLLGLIISAAVILHLPEELFSWILLHVE